MKRKITRIVAFLMAVIMCMPSSITALAAEVGSTEAASSYVAAITPSDHGTIAFTGYTGNSREFNQGDTVDITLRPDTGYQVSQFKVTNTDTGKVLAQKDTANNRFTFAMPEKNVTITAIFDTAEKAIEIPEGSTSDDTDENSGDDDGEGDPGSSGEEATLTTNIIALNLDEEIAQEVTEIAQETIAGEEGLDENAMAEPLIAEYDENGLAQTTHFATLMYTIVDKNAMKPVPAGVNAIDYLFNENMAAFYTTVYDSMPVYNSIGRL